MAKDPYKILGVDKKASAADIKAAYRKMAKKYHPDLNPDDEAAQQTFKDASAAYDFLSDKEKRAAFDRGEIDMDGQPQWSGGAGGRQYYRGFAGSPSGARYQAGGNINPEDIEDIFGSFFGGGGSPFGAAQRTGGGFEDAFRQQQKADVHYHLDAGFMDAATGAKKRVTMPDGKTLDISIPAGVKDGQKLRLKGKGQKIHGGRTGDAYVEIRVKPHKTFTRQGNDVYADVPVGLHEAVLGEKITVQTVHGPVQMTLPKGTSSGQALRLRGKGIKGGDHYARVKIVMPPKIDSELENAIKSWAEKHAYNPRKDTERTS